MIHEQDDEAARKWEQFQKENAVRHPAINASPECARASQLSQTLSRGPHVWLTARQPLRHNASRPRWRYGQAVSTKPYLKPMVLFYKDYLLGEDPTDVQRGI
jgi:hypothetical protein